MNLPAEIRLNQAELRALDLMVRLTAWIPKEQHPELFDVRQSKAFAAVREKIAKAREKK